jgi:hypothetical protein
MFVDILSQSKNNETHSIEKKIKIWWGHNAGQVEKEQKYNAFYVCWYTFPEQNNETRSILKKQLKYAEAIARGRWKRNKNPKTRSILKKQLKYAEAITRGRWKRNKNIKTRSILKKQ